MNKHDQEFMRVAIAEARKCEPEDERSHPLVGAVVVRNGKQLAVAHRGELAPGDHAEYTALETKLASESVSGSTVFTTLEPCTSRNHPKVPCVERLIERKVSRVVIGMLDPNRKITGKGVLALRRANVNVEFFQSDLMMEIEELNREFIRAKNSVGINIEQIIDKEFIERHRSRSLDSWYNMLNYVYWDRNFNRDPMDIFAHLVEVTGGLSLLASSKTKPGVVAEEFVAKSIAWWLALCGKVGVKSVEAMLWAKFPNVCTYCQQNPHDNDECEEKKAQSGGPPWALLGQIGAKEEMPHSIGEWQRMFSSLYPAQQVEEFGPSFARLTEELGELAEALRVFPAEPGYFLSEASDVFAWLMHIQNIIDQKRRTPKAKRGELLEYSFCFAYPDRCLDCNEAKCSCPPILEETIGRIAHEVPAGKGSFGADGSFMTVDRARLQFKLPS